MKWVISYQGPLGWGKGGARAGGGGGGEGGVEGLEGVYRKKHGRKWWQPGTVPDCRHRPPGLHPRPALPAIDGRKAGLLWAWAGPLTSPHPWHRSLQFHPICVNTC